MAMGYSSEDKAGRKGIETVCRVCQTNGAGPCGKEIIIGSVSVKHGNTIQKRKGGGEARGGGGWPEATVQIQKAHEDPGAPQQHRPCQRMSVIHKLTEVIPWLSPAMQQASLLSAERTERKPERGEAGRREGCTGEPVSFFQPSLVRAHRHCPKITIALF